MARRLPAALCCFSCCLGLAAASAPVNAASPAPAATSPLEDGGQKLADNDVQGAIHSLQDLVRHQPDNAEALHLLTIAFLYAGQNSQAANTAEAALRQPSLAREDRASNALLLGQARYGAFLEAAKEYHEQADSLPNMSQLLNQMSTHTFQTGSEDVRGKYVVVMSGDVNAADDLRSEQISLHDQIRKLITTLEQAHDAFRLALETDPGLPWGHDGLGLVEIAQGYPGTARSEFLRELSLHGANGITYGHLGELEAYENHTSDAVEDLRLASTLSPELQMPYEDLIALYTKQHDEEHTRWAKGMLALTHGDFREAGKDLKGESVSSADLLCAQARLSLAQKHWAEADRLLARARNVDAHNAQIVTVQGDLEEAMGLHAKAIIDYRQALDIDPDCDAAWYGLGLIYDAQGDRESARADYLETLRVNPYHTMARLGLAKDEVELGQQTAAQANLQDYLKRFPTASNTYAVQSMLARLEAK